MGIMITDPDLIALMRMNTLLKALELEVRTGMRLSRGKTAYGIVKAEYGLKGNKQRVLDQFSEMVRERKFELEVNQ